MVAKMKEEQLLLSRMKDLGERSYRTGQYTFSGFLSQSEISTFLSVSKEFEQYHYTVYGGWAEAERMIIRFGSAEEIGYETEFPICCVMIKPLLKKFADQLSHRDFLGALMNLGIERTLIGDILVFDQEARIFCANHIADFIIENLDKVCRTSVKCTITQEPIPEIENHMQEELETVASERLDAVIAKIFKLSRSESLELFRQKKVFVNSVIYENNSYTPKIEDRISVRGFGKFIYMGVNHTTKKGKISIRIKKFV